ncbi:unnamed protein product, partial [Amoebophrya sp. A25]
STIVGNEEDTSTSEVDEQVHHDRSKTKTMKNSAVPFAPGQGKQQCTSSMKASAVVSPLKGDGGGLNLNFSGLKLNTSFIPVTRVTEQGSTGAVATHVTEQGSSQHNESSALSPEGVPSTKSSSRQMFRSADNTRAARSKKQKYNSIVERMTTKTPQKTLAVANPSGHSVQVLAPLMPGQKRASSSAITSPVSPSISSSSAANAAQLKVNAPGAAKKRKTAASTSGIADDPDEGFESPSASKASKK